MSNHFNKSQLEGLSPQQRCFAQQQFRSLYAQEMSRVSQQLSHKQKVLSNLHTLDQQQSKHIKNQYQKLKNKMIVTQKKRNKNMTEKIKYYKQNDERWFHKMKQIQSKMKQQNLQAIEKAEKYRQQSQLYWKNKEKKALQNTRIHCITNSKANHMKSLSNSSLYYDPTIMYDSYQRQYKRKPITTQINSINNIKKTNEHSDSLDKQIKLHRQKSENLQKQKQQLVFQKAVQKMNKIKKKREVIKKMKEVKPVQPTKPRKIDHYYRQFNQKGSRFKKHSMSEKNHQSLVHHSRQQLDKSIKQHQQTKLKLQYQQFLHRGQIMQNAVQRSRRDKILKMVKNKVQQAKIDTIKRQNSKSHI